MVNNIKFVVLLSLFASDLFSPFNDAHDTPLMGCYDFKTLPSSFSLSRLVKMLKFEPYCFAGAGIDV